MDNKLKILIVEDEVMIAKHIEDIVNSDGHKSLGIAYDSETALDYVYSRQPELLILDINIDGNRDGIEVAEIIKEKYQIPFIFLTALSDISTLDRAKKVNPCAYIVKPFKAKDLLTSITIGMFNYQYRQTSAEFNLKAINDISSQALTEKEFEVLLDIKDGLTNAQIAKKQFLSLSTIKFHSKNIYEKLEVKNRTSAIKKLISI